MSECTDASNEIIMKVRKDMCGNRDRRRPYLGSIF